MTMPRWFRYEHESGSYIEPKFNESWDDLTKLCWYSGVVLEDTGYEVVIVTNSCSQGGKVRTDWYGYHYGDTGGGCYSYEQLWTWLSGFSAGASMQVPV